ncbi:MAG: IclR family transcriptional regulator [Acidimicrobiales bacterium]
MTAEVRSGAQSVERALLVLRAFESGPIDLGVTEIASRTGLSVSTAHRLVRALCVGGLLRQDPGTERYQLGPALVVLGRRAEEQLGYARTRPVLDELARATGESVNLGIQSGDEVLVVLDVPSEQPLRFDQAAGTRIPIHSSAMGKCLLAFSDNPDGVLDELPRLRRLTDRTITNRPALRDELQRTRERGWALNDEERHAGVRTVAAPVPGAEGWAVAAVAVQGPAVRLDDGRLGDVARELEATAKRLTPLLGAAGMTSTERPASPPALLVPPRRER